ncbi:bifunctional [glutamate--ammonia ligase]-adenylyl-L-tyrosine phosphorylase/[glutamate--ammonia-ligase] adenylyltransferase [Thalassotalea sp. M1531]|uniref:Bifunctional glutamine synthetase adenylyltransferase/adenylyl-removing enzyme n=1 Tax=Thalassotalea algicola TaxID=2716224 RepID=A0A7Y0LDE7_9GAMM|nr:bifunctional [glutamate--ammonia ligase]-adenylyl-L-tyrosine phosphorylase/[glutamate--ammonia-ligase] adenylyltransferase [Thalassotalea algicola]NMP32257.1 bifunctional [glutamate--ammonia ligase]-adenylyl-L-tyrosine phosphorylase/[glutamate--ammonia-ligase] adenylyltransferase [Thalassotalea algicola]
MSICNYHHLPEKLQELAQNRWEVLNERYPELFTSFPQDKLQTFLHSLALSDFIFRTCQLVPHETAALFQSQSFDDHLLPNYRELLAQQLANCDSEEQLHKQLRIFRHMAMAEIAVADMIANTPLKDSLSKLSNLADALILEALNWLSHYCQSRWGKPLNHAGEEQHLLVYGMGKLGGQELNFSSDIDLIFVYPESGETVGARKSLDNHSYFTRLGQKLITALNQQTAEGFVYRVDMRLRPFGDSGPLVLSFAAIEDYYQEQGRDWERYAMLKARPIGSGQSQEQLTELLRPFVFRRYIDFSVIESLRKMKMMIAQEVRRKQLIHNIKLGAGGIREVEFIVQVFQLIRGGRVQALQERNLLKVLPLLVTHDAMSDQSSQVLADAYCFLRRVENIIQAFDDKQTQTLPDDELNQQRLISILKFATWSDFILELNSHLANVHQEFNLLIGEEAPNHEDVELDWQTLWLNRWQPEEGFEWQIDIAINWQTEAIWQELSQFKLDIEKRAIGQRGRQVLDKLMPRVLWRIHSTTSSELVLPRILQIINKIASRTAYLELLFENDGALIQLIKLCQKSAWICDYIAKFPILLDELIDPKLLNNPPALSEYAKELKLSMLRIPEEDIESQMDALRQFKQAQQLRIAAADVSGVLPVMKVSDHLTALAEAILDEVIQQAWQQLTRRFGQPKSTLGTEHKGFAVIGYGKMGGIELGYGSDLDLVFIHNSTPDDVTVGEREISATQFYVKLAQKIMHIFNTRMSSGILYELDMRLRPSGNSGVLVIRLSSFEEYQREEAWTWEHQALVRSRMIYGYPEIAEDFEKVRHQILSQPREQNSLKQDVIEMREKMRNHIDKSTAEHIDIKHGKGGLVDIEFLAQYLVLYYSAQHSKLTAYSDNVRIFEQLTEVEILTRAQSAQLIESYCALRDTGHSAVLQNKASLIEKELFSLYAKPVVKIWQQFLTA